MVGIKDAKMPKSCMFCQFHDQMYNRCDVGFFDTNAKFIKGDAAWSFKHPNCPLVETEESQDAMLEKIKSEILEEKECAYADFEKYKVDYLGVDAEYVEDELPQDDFRYGMERALEIINKYKKEGASCEG